MGNNMVFVIFGLRARWDSFDQQLTMLSEEFSSSADWWNSAGRQLE